MISKEDLSTLIGIVVLVTVALGLYFLAGIRIELSTLAGVVTGVLAGLITYLIKK